MRLDATYCHSSVVYQMGMDGRSPFPAGFWREGQGSAAFSVNVEYLAVERHDCLS